MEQGQPQLQISAAPDGRILPSAQPTPSFLWDTIRQDLKSKRELSRWAGHTDLKIAMQWRVKHDTTASWRAWAFFSGPLRSRHGA